MQIEPSKLYTGKTLITKLGLRKFQDLVAAGRLVWVQDNSFGDKLYRMNQ